MMRRRALALIVAVPAAAAAGAAVWIADSSGEGGSEAAPSPSPSDTSPAPAASAVEPSPAPTAATRKPTGPVPGLVPAPVEAFADQGRAWTLPAQVRVRAEDDARPIADLLAADLRTATGRTVTVAAPGDAPASEGDIELVLDKDGFDRSGGLEGDDAYTLDVTRNGVVVRAPAPAGLFRGAQTLRQLVPVKAPFTLPGAAVRDAPRYAYRGVMIDLARHFYPPAQMRRLIDDIAGYKFNHLHLHLTDDQGWRIAIDGWPKLTGVGAATQVGGGPGGFWTAEDYRAITGYAAERFITVVPEFDMPGHTNAAILAYPELACDGKKHTPYTGTQVGFSSFCIEGDATYTFVDDVLGKLARLTPGPWLHIGGDEAHTLEAAEYEAFMTRVQPMVAKHGKKLIAWHQLAHARPVSGATLQYWGAGRDDAKSVVAAARAGAKVIMSPADHVYLDMKYDGTEKLGTKWAGTVDVRRSYEWEPATHLPGMPADAVIGVEGALWGDTVHGVADAEYLMFPRVAAVAELAWSRPKRRGWADFRTRVGMHQARWKAAGINCSDRLD